jgi:hypothetical protein
MRCTRLRGIGRLERRAAVRPLAACDGCRIERQDEAAAGNAALDVEHDAAGPRIHRIGIDRERAGQREIDLADMILRDRVGLGRRQLAGIDRLLDRHDGAARLRGADPHIEAGADLERRLVQPEHPGPQPMRCLRPHRRGRHHVAAVEEDFAVERDPDGLSGAGAVRRMLGHRPGLDRS